VALGLAVVGIVASAQAGTSTKVFEAEVHVTTAAAPDPNTFTLTLTNDKSSQQALGSANFTAPGGIAVPASTQKITLPSGRHWTVASDGGSIVTFRADTNGDGLVPTESISADVTVTIPTTCSPAGPALWKVDAKQSNDFSGQPGNGFVKSTKIPSPLTPLARFAFDPPIGTASGTTPSFFVPQIKTKAFDADGTTIVVKAYDTCGALDADYSGATIRPTPANPTRLDTATFDPSSGLSWDGAGTGTVVLTPDTVESNDTLTVTDGQTGIKKQSDAFDVVERICAGANSACTWSNGRGTINANSTLPDGTSSPSLGLGFRKLTPTCSGASGLSIKGDAIDISPHHVAAYQVTLTYSKSETGNGPASGFVFCISDDDSFSFHSIGACPATPPTPPLACVVSQKRVTNGALEFVLSLPPGDPWGGGFG
jgi:hypothetical protein